MAFSVPCNGLHAFCEEVYCTVHSTDHSVDRNEWNWDTAECGDGEDTVPRDKKALQIYWWRVASDKHKFDDNCFGQ